MNIRNIKIGVLICILTLPFVAYAGDLVPKSSGGSGTNFFTQSGNTIGQNTGSVVQVGSITATSTATSTFASGINLTGGCLAQNSNCIGQLATTTQISSLNVAAWGDSLTIGTGASSVSTTYPSLLSNYVWSGANIYNGGIGGNTSSQILTRFLFHPELWGRWTVIWSGRNNAGSPSQVESDIAAMVADLPSPKNFAVLSIINANNLNGAGEPATSTTYSQVTTLNSALQGIYPNNFYDVRAYLLSACNTPGPTNTTGWNASTTADQYDCAHGMYPESLSYDGLHFNSSGYGVIAKGVGAFIMSITSRTPAATNFTDLVPGVNGLVGLVSSSPLDNWFMDTSGNSSASGSWNFGIGQGNLNNLTTGNDNIGIGYNTLNKITTGSDNIALGQFALQAAPTNAGQNIGIGYAAGYHGPADTALAIGWSSLFTANSSSEGDTGLGFSSLYSASSGSSNTGVGTRSGENMTTGSGNSFLGAFAGGDTNYANNVFSYIFNKQLSTGSDNTFVGYFASPATNSILNNATAVGYASQVGCSNCLVLGATSTNAVNVGIGTTSPWATLSVSGSIQQSGTLPLFAVASTTKATLFDALGNGNVGVGTTTPGTLFSLQGIANFAAATSTFQSTGGINLTKGCFAVNGVCVGGGAGGSGTVNYGYTNHFAYYASDGTAVSDISALYTTGLGTLYTMGGNTLDDGSCSMQVQNMLTVGGDAGIIDSGNLQLLAITGCNGATSALATDDSGFTYCETSVSDERLKQNIKPIDQTTELAKDMQLIAVMYQYNDAYMQTPSGKNGNDNETTEQYGLLAQAVQGIFPDLVDGTTTPKEVFVKNVGTTTVPQYLSIDYAKLSVHILAGMQAQQAEITALQGEVEALKNK